MFKTRNDLPAGKRERLIAILNQRLADLIDLHAQAKHAHWNVKGAQFFSLHKLFDELAGAVDGFVDKVAERAVQLGGVAEGTVQIVGRRTALKEYPSSIAGGMDHVAALSGAIAALGSAVRGNIEEAASLGDADTADLFTEVSQGLDKYLWFVEAHGQAE